MTLDHRPPARLRPLRAADRGFFRSLAEDERVVRYVGDGRPWSDAYAERRFGDALAGGTSADRKLSWSIAETAPDVPIGLLALTYLPNETELGYWISPSHWGRGHGAKLVRHALAAAAEHAPGKPLVPHIHPDNVRSRLLIERAGFVERDHGPVGPTPELQFWRYPVTEPRH